MTDDEPVPAPDADDGDVAELSQREREVAGLLVLGLTNQEIGDQLSLSPHTVKTYTQRVYRKLGTTNRTQTALVVAGRIRSRREDSA